MKYFRSWTGTRFVSRAPTKSGKDVALRVAKLDLPHVLWWHSHCQPIIDRDPQRADYDWNWLLYAPFTFVAGGIMRRRPAGYAVGMVSQESDRFMPCALALLLGRYPFLNDHRRRSTFDWFMTTAPVEAMVTVPEFPLTEDRVPKRLGTIALDVAVTHSLNHFGRGRVGLHAAETGGEQLLQWYKDQGMHVLAPEEKLPFGFQRMSAPNDGRYCYFTVDGALKLSRGLDHLR